LKKTVPRLKRDRHHLGSVGLYIGVLLPQLRQMLSSRHSSKMPQKDQQNFTSS
jgi:hypothetical protein